MDHQFIDLDDILIDADEIEKTEVVKRGIYWESFRSTYVSDEELEMMIYFDRHPLERGSLVTGDDRGKEYIRLILTFLARLKGDGDLEYVLSLLDELLLSEDGDNSVIQCFVSLIHHPPIAGIPQLPFGPLFSILSRKKNKPFIINRTFSILSVLLVFPIQDIDNETKEVTMQWCVDMIKENKNFNCSAGDDPKRRLLSTTLVGLRKILTRNQFRVAFFNEGGCSALYKLLKYDEPNPYKVQVKKKMIEPELSYNLCKIIKNVPPQKVKIVRQVLSICRNVIDCGTNNEFFISYGLNKTVAQLQAKVWGDEEIIADLEWLKEELEKYVDLLSSFDRYKNEILSRELVWSPTHKSERFWNENVTRFEENEFQCLKILKEILMSSKDPNVLSVAAWDVGEFVRHHPRGKLIVQGYEMKMPLMKLLNNADSTVKGQALLSLQKLMVTNCQVVSPTSTLKTICRMMQCQYGI